MTQSAVWWIRRDLRLRDNQALSCALATADQVVPIFVLDPHLLGSQRIGSKRLAFLLGGLRELDKELRECNSRLIVRHGDPAAYDHVSPLVGLVSETNSSVVFAEEDFSPYARRRDSRAATRLPLKLVNGLTVHDPRAIMKSDGTPYTLFSAYAKTWKELPLPQAKSILPRPRSIRTPSSLDSLPIPDTPTLPHATAFLPGEAEANRRLRGFLLGQRPAIQRYARLRDRLDLAATSHLSPYFRFGMISARHASAAALTAIESSANRDARKGAIRWLDEIIWRDFFHYTLYHFPRVSRQSYRKEFSGIRWKNDETHFVAWCKGLTGYPVVDAAMRELNESGWIHNRARMIAASFLVKDLLIDWRWGEQYFMRHLLDGDPAANNGGWQWVAGTGTDAAPYFRVFNPTRQGALYDPAGTFVRRWVPELTNVPDRHIHEPWRMPKQLQESAGCIVGQDYPIPILDHSQARKRALAEYKQAKQRHSPRGPP